MNDDSNLKKYRRILRVRSYFFLVFFFGSFSSIALGLAIGSENTALALFMGNGFILGVISFWLKAIDLCPWCNMPFLSRVEVGAVLKDKETWVSRKNCAYCGMPGKGKNS